jgi:hypothetical protein
MNVATYIKYIAIPQPKSDINSQHIPEHILMWLHNNRNRYYTNSIFSPPYDHPVVVYIFFLAFSSIPISLHNVCYKAVTTLHVTNPGNLPSFY